MAFMDDEYIESAKSVPCCCCPAGVGDECSEPVSGQPLLETKGYPVHMRRLNG
jgi:hypothetical protein